MIKTTIAAIGLAFAGLFGSPAVAHADPTDGMCGSGQFYNPYFNECRSTDRGAYPQPSYHNPGSNDGIGGFGGGRR